MRAVSISSENSCEKSPGLFPTAGAGRAGKERGQLPALARGSALIHVRSGLSRIHRSLLSLSSLSFFFSLIFYSFPS